MQPETLEIFEVTIGSSGPAGLVNHTPGPLYPKITQRQRHHRHADREPSVAIGKLILRNAVRHSLFHQQHHDRTKGRCEERGHTRSRPHQKGREPPQIAQRDSKKNTVASRTFDIVLSSHTHLE